MSAASEQITVTQPDSSSFYERNREGLAELFDEMGIPSGAADDLESAVAHTQPWTAGDYSRPKALFGIPEAKRERLLGLYDSFGLRDRLTLPPGHFEEFDVMGAVQNGIDRRLEFTAQTLADPKVSVDRLTLLSGQRPIFIESEKDDIDSTLTRLRTKQTRDPWLKGVLEDPSKLVWESDLVRMTAADRLGPLAMHGIELRLGDSDPVQSIELASEGMPPVRLIHSLAVERAKGDKRPNSESTLRDWLRLYPPIEGARVAFIAANPHLERMTKSAQYVINKEGRSDIQLVPAGPGATDKISHPHYLAETAQNLYEDLRAESV